MQWLAHSETVCLRRLDRSDLDAFFTYRSDPQVARYQSWADMTRDQALGFLTAMETTPLFRPGEWAQIAVSDTNGGLMGDMGLFLSETSEHAELGITLAREFWGQGNATAAMRLAIDLTWTESPADGIRAWADQRNTASVALLHRLDMTHLGTETTDVVEEAFALPRPR